jgi:ABC-2 type transport system permease protein
VIRHFASLKARLIRNGLRGGGIRLVGFIVGVVLGGQLAVSGFALLALPPNEIQSRAALPVGLFAGLMVAWIVFPLFGYGIDETLDPDRLNLLPLPRWRLMAGLLAASCVGIAPVATLTALSGALVGYRAPGLGTLVVAAAVLIELALCLVASRAVTTALSRLLRSRKARDIWLVLLTFFFVALGLLGQLPRLLGSGRKLTPAGAHRVVSVLGWLPPGLAGRAVGEAGSGHSALAALELVPAAAFVLLGMAWWSRNLERLTTTAEAHPSGARAPSAEPAGRATAPDLFPRFATFLPRNRRGAVAAKEIRYLWREPALRAQRFTTGIFLMAGLVATAVSPGLHRPPAVLASAAAVWWLGLNALSQFAADRGAYWMNAVAAGDPADDLIGKNMAIMLVNLPVFLVLGAAVAEITHGWGYLPLAAALGVGALGVAYGVGNVVSVRLAQPLPESTTNLWAARSGQGCGTALLMLLVLFLSQALILPVAALVAVGFLVFRPMLVVAAVVAPLYGAAAYVIGLRMAGGWLREHQAELLVSLSPRRMA